MYTYILILEHADDFSRVVETVESLGTPHIEADGRVMLASGEGTRGGWIAVQKSLAVEQDYNPDPLAEIKKLTPDPTFVVVEGRTGDKFADEFLLRLKTSGATFVDNDHGLVAPLSDFKALVSRGANWLHMASKEPVPK